MALAVAAGSPAAEPAQKVSCHIIVKETAAPDISHVFAGLEFPMSFLVERVGGRYLCTTALALLTCLRSHAANLLASRNIAIDPSILSVIQGSHPLAANIMVATSRTLDFANQTYRNYQNGFQELGGLLGFSSTIPLAEFDDAIDVPSVTENGPEAPLFFDTWSTMDVVPRSHFVLFFIITQTPLFPLISLPLGYDIPSLDFGGDFSLPPVKNGHQTSALLHSTLTPSSASVSPSRSSQRQSRSPSSYPTQRHSNVSKSEAIIEICQSKITEFESIRPKAQFQSGNCSTSLASLARSFYFMERLIVGLGLEPGDLKSSRSFTLQNGNIVELNLEQVLGNFAWTAPTFGKKWKLYKLAKAIALRAWNDHTDATPELRNIYLSIKFLWAKNGPLDDLNIPLPSPEGQGDEKCAANLKQVHLAKCHTLHNKYTSES
ncbi:hypothetical protein K438DRAFT_1894072 [Mycena galopus ATCC 62051]|nr:hypothetical protein K438DRAFT_1894072 [Mycena galopus ATCC 62051]